ncbi:hypothetical protein L209DRAFT_406992 [Thermothelomyces heterothallicus CBS 203.75]
MPLHLLGKKSWNVYSPANIARVRRDEAEAQAREEAQERRMQEIDAARRLAILRGEIPPPLEDAEPGPPSQIRDGERDRLRDDYSALTSGRKRRRRGEDDTDFEMRIARERAAVGDRTARELAAPASLIDSKGHLTLFAPPEPSPPRGGKDDEAAHREREDKDQYQMRFVNAAGRDGQGLTDGGPWYASRAGVSSAALAPSKNVFGQEDPRRKERAAARLDASDPLAIMKQGAKMVRELEKERRREAEERERELRALEREERRRERKRRKREDEGEEEEEGKEERYDEKTRRRRRSRERRRDSPDGESDSARRERSHRHRDDGRGERDRYRSGERERTSRNERDGSDRRKDPHQDYQDRRRDGSRERRRRPEEDDGRERPRRGDGDRARRSHKKEDYSREIGWHRSELS